MACGEARTQVGPLRGRCCCSPLATTHTPPGLNAAVDSSSVENRCWRRGSPRPLPSSDTHTPGNPRCRGPKAMASSERGGAPPGRHPSPTLLRCATSPPEHSRAKICRRPDGPNHGVKPALHPRRKTRSRRIRAREPEDPRRPGIPRNAPGHPSTPSPPARTDRPEACGNEWRRASCPRATDDPPGAQQATSKINDASCSFCTRTRKPLCHQRSPPASRPIPRRQHQGHSGATVQLDAPGGVTPKHPRTFCIHPSATNATLAASD